MSETIDPTSPVWVTGETNTTTGSTGTAAATGAAGQLIPFGEQLDPITGEPLGRRGGDQLGDVVHFVGADGVHYPAIVTAIDPKFPDHRDLSVNIGQAWSPARHIARDDRGTFRSWHPAD